MRVLFNGMASVIARTGIGHYTGELVRCLRTQAGMDAVDCFPPPWLATVRRLGGHWSSSAGGSGRASSGMFSSVKARVGTAGRAAFNGLVANRFQAACRRGDYDLYHEPNVVPLQSDLPTITTVHDLSVLLHPQWHPGYRVAWYEKHFADGIARSRLVLTDTEFSRREILQTLGLSPERVVRAYVGVRPNLVPLPPEKVAAGLRALDLPQRYLLFLGTLEPRKNVLMLLRVYCSLPSWLRERYPLVLVGGEGWNSTEIHDYIDQEARHKNVLHLGYLSDEHLATLYNGARALLFPSFYEGFGLPPLEMMACGGAVIASTAGAVAEVAGRKAHLIDPEDRAGWREAMFRVATDDDWWQQLRRGAEEVARPFTWERCAAETVAAYKRMLRPSERVAQPQAA